MSRNCLALPLPAPQALGEGKGWTEAPAENGDGSQQMGAWTEELKVILLLLDKQQQTDKQNKGEGGNVDHDPNAESQSVEGRGKEEKVLKKSL